MSHEINISIAGKASIAYVEEKPWHGLGQQLTRGAPIETWVREAGMDYTIESTPLSFNGQTYPGRVALVRTDTGAPLGIVSPDYKVVQPLEVLEFFRDLTTGQGWELETAGVLFQGQKYWALARTGENSRVGTKNSKDIMKGYVLLATSCDGTLATTAKHTAIRVVCNNTLTMATGRHSAEAAIKVNHRTTFQASKVHQALGIDTGWNQFMDQVNGLASVPMADEKALEFIQSLVKPDWQPEKSFKTELLEYKAPAFIWALYKGQGRGMEMASAKGTAWGLLNAVTEYTDHLAGGGADRRLQQAWFKKGDELKTQALNDLLAMV